MIDWPPDDELVRRVVRAGNFSAAAGEYGCSRSTLRERLRSRGLYDKARAALAEANRPTPPRPGEPDPLVEQIRTRLKGGPVGVGDLADALDVAPRRVRDALDELRAQGFRIPEEDAGRIELQRVPPSKEHLHKLDERLLDGDVLRVGVVSDTHLCSNEEALEELHLAYDVFAREGIGEVWHAGDFVAGVGIFRTQASELKRHTFEAQVAYLVEHYPRREGIVTRGISGNHDIEGDFGKIGANPVVAAANQRPDIKFLGDYSAWLELPGGSWTHLLHGKGGMSYAYSYKAQKLVDGYPAGRKPALLVCGHWHVRGNICARNVEVLWPGCFEWRSKFLERLGLHPRVGFYILTLTLGDDGSLVRFLPEWFGFYEGRVVGGSLAA